MASVAHERPPVSDCSSKKVAFLQGATDASIGRRASDQRTGRRIGGQIGDQRRIRIGAPRDGLLDRGQTADQKLIVIRLKDHSDVPIGIRQYIPNR